MSTPAIVVDDVTVTYRTPSTAESDRGIRRLGVLLGRGGTVEVQAVRGVSMVVYEGEVVGVVGGNGSGKSTLLRAIAGLMPLSSGDIWVSGETRLLGVNAALLPELSGERNVYLGGLAHGLSPRQVREQTREVIEFADIGHAIYRPMKTYSSGMGARLRFAIASSFEPDVLLVDEALGTGDAEFRARSEERLARLRDRAGTVVLVSHSLSSVADLCDRVVWLHEGVVRADGEPGEVLDGYTRYTKAVELARSTGRARPAPPPPSTNPYVRPYALGQALEGPARKPTQ